MTLVQKDKLLVFSYYEVGDCKVARRSSISIALTVSSAAFFLKPAPIHVFAAELVVISPDNTLV